MFFCKTISLANNPALYFKLRPLLFITLGLVVRESKSSDKDYLKFVEYRRLDTTEFFTPELSEPLADCFEVLVPLAVFKSVLEQ
jgi:hypothetical protein